METYTLSRTAGSLSPLETFWQKRIVGSSTSSMGSSSISDMIPLNTISHSRIREKWTIVITEIPVHPQIVPRTTSWRNLIKEDLELMTILERNMSNASQQNWSKSSWWNSVFWTLHVCRYKPCTKCDTSILLATESLKRQRSAAVEENSSKSFPSQTYVSIFCLHFSRVNTISVSVHVSSSIRQSVGWGEERQTVFLFGPNYRFHLWFLSSRYHWLQLCFVDPWEVLLPSSLQISLHQETSGSFSAPESKINSAYMYICIYENWNCSTAWTSYMKV